MAYWAQLWSAATVNAAAGKWGGAVLTKTPIRTYMIIKSPVLLKRALRKSTPAYPLPLEVETIYLAISDNPTTSGDGSISPNGQGFT